MKCENENDRHKPLLIIKDYGYGTATTAAGDGLHNPTAAITSILNSWLNGHWLRYVLLIICSPLLFPIVCVISPFLCAAEVCFCFCRRRRLKSDPPQPLPVISTPPPPLHHRNDVNPKVSLLDRYLDDQLELALEILDECSGDLGYCYDYMDDFDCNRSNELC